MNKKLLVLIIILALILSTLLGSWIVWYSKPDKPLNIFILDKTVPTVDRVEHKSLVWILNHNKYTKRDGSSYEVNKDYYGFFPLNTKSQEFDFKSLRIHEVQDAALDYDALYYADTYGVYYNEWYKNKAQDTDISQKVYGGLNQNDYLLLKEMKELKKLIITEFNLYNAPTSGLIREKVEDLFGINWSGWTGKYFPSLDTASADYLPEWIVTLYKEQNDQQWPFTKAGIVLIHKFGTIAVLEQDNHLTEEIPWIISPPETVERFDVAEKVYYPHWFDITFSGDRNEVLANFKFSVNARGDSVLRSYNLRPIFPAVIEHTRNYQFYYFGGNFAANSVNNNTAYFEGFPELMGLLTRNNYKSTKEFYHKFYHPLMTKIFDNYYETIENN
ncbi:MAG: hypothetical protein V2I54_11915 [Bacteroidales bacterium]|jgi:hypothetical protein|nr:hypothetical protein [Bacteroidales bacterium]